jgi:hypothetical protein
MSDARAYCYYGMLLAARRVDRRGKPLTLQLTMLTPAAGGAVRGTATQIFTQDFQDGGITVKQQLSLASSRHTRVCGAR